MLRPVHEKERYCNDEILKDLQNIINSVYNEPFFHAQSDKNNNKK
jgi:hypothetical protein